MEFDTWYIRTRLRALMDAARSKVGYISFRAVYAIIQ